MKIFEPQERSPKLLEQLLDVWERSVRATHLFLSDQEVCQIRQYVPQVLYSVQHLVIAADENIPLGFMGVEGKRLEMLFLAPEERGKGVGRKLLEHGIDAYSVDHLTVNEQNPDARGFYEHMGFRVYRRTELDGQGNPYPLLYMRRISR